MRWRLSLTICGEPTKDRAMLRRLSGGALAILVAGLIGASTRSTSYADEGLVARGGYLVQAAGCVSCHTDKKAKGPRFAGGRGLKTPFGTFYSPNITPDPATGIGNWSEDDFLRALKAGLRPDGAHYFPVFPYTTYTKMADDDARAIKAYLFSLKPVARPNRRHDVAAPFGWRWTIGVWKALYFEAGPLEPDPSRSATWNRGAYLATLAHCGECHTPRNFAGAMDRTMWMAGTVDGPDGDLAPNITSEGETGIGDWSQDELVFFLKNGTKPDYEEAEGAMAETIEDGLSHLGDADLHAIATYILELPPIYNYLVE